MDLKDYRQMPDEGTFEKVQQRLHRKLVVRRTAAVVAAAAVVASVVLLTATPSTKSENNIAATGDKSSPTMMASAPAPLATATPSAPSPTQPATASTAQTAAPSPHATATTAATAAEAPATAAAPADVTDDELALIAAMLPQGTPTVMPLDVAVSATPSTPLQTLAPDTDANATPHPGAAADNGKAGQPVPHFDNVIWAPNMIIPSSDIDENRTFSIQTTSEITAFKLHIYNRAGRRVYLSTDPHFVWDATMDGTPLPQGAYVWVATFRDSDGNARQEQGTVTVVR